MVCGLAVETAGAAGIWGGANIGAGNVACSGGGVGLGTGAVDCVAIDVGTVGPQGGPADVGVFLWTRLEDTAVDDGGGWFN